MKQIIAIFSLFIFYSCSEKEFVGADMQPYPDLVLNSNRITNDSGYIKVDSVEGDSIGVYLTYGQSNTVNSGDLGYKPFERVYMLFNQTVYKYKDPSLGAAYTGGSVWGRVGDHLIKEKVHNKVVFANAGMGGLPIELLNKGGEYKYFANCFYDLQKRFGYVSGILFHQGESNNKNELGHSNYYKDFELLLENMKNDGMGEVPFFLSRASLCGPHNPVDSNLLSIQNKIISDFPNIYAGPNTDELNDPSYRLTDGCHFSALGFDQFSLEWLKSIKAEKVTFQ